MKVDIKKDNVIMKYSWRIKKMYEKAFYPSIEELRLTQGEIDILLFLSNNKPLDTAKDIVQYRFISKSMVSKSVDLLTNKGYLSYKTDLTDKRSIHLTLEPAVIPIVDILQAVQRNFLCVLLKDVSEEEYEITKKVLNKIDNNISYAYGDKAMED